MFLVLGCVMRGGGGDFVYVCVCVCMCAHIHQQSIDAINQPHTHTNTTTKHTHRKAPEEPVVTTTSLGSTWRGDPSLAWYRSA